MNFHNRARMSTGTTGTGTLTLGTAQAGYCSFAEAGVANGDRVSYVLEDGSNFEVGQGVYSSSGTTLSRLKVLLSKISGQAADTSPISLSGSAKVFLTATAEDIRDRGPYFSVKAFGAVGDGTTQDHAAIQAAVDAADASAVIKAVYLPDPPVAYTFGDTVTVPEGVTIFGDNIWDMQRSRCKPAAAFTDPLFESDDYGNSRVLRMAIKGLFIDGSSTTFTAIRANCQQSVFQDLCIRDCFTYGIHIGGVGSADDEQALNNIIDRNYLAGQIGTTEFFDGIFLDYNTADTKINLCYVEAAKDALIRSRAYNDQITGCHLFGSSGSGGGIGVGYYSETSADKTFTGNYIENTNREGVFIDGGASDVATLNATLTGNNFRNIDKGNTASGVIVVQGSNVSSFVATANVVRRDAATSYATAYFVYFNGITPTRVKVFGNEWQDSLVTTAETNLTSSFDYQPLDADLTALAGLSSTGMIARTGDGTAAVRTITAGNGASVSNGNGVSGNPTISGAAGFRNIADISGGDTIIATDYNKLVRIATGTGTLAFAAAATLGSTFLCTIQNAGLGEVTLNPDGAELIDGLSSWVLYPRGSIQLYCDGSALYSVLLSPMRVTYNGSATFVRPGVGTMVVVEAWGAGGSGGRGDTSVAGGGGGGGAYVTRTIHHNTLSSTVSVTVGAGGAARTTNQAGAAGGDTSFGPFLFAFGGGGGAIGAGGNGGGGAGNLSAGTANINGGQPATTGTAGLNNEGDGGGNGNTLGGAGGSSSTGGGGGGGGDAATGGAGGASAFGGGGGGGGGDTTAGGNGGGSTYGGNGGAGATGAANATAGSQPGGGGGGSETGNSGAGGDGRVIVMVF